MYLGRSTQVWEIRITDGQDALVCISRLTLAVVAPADAMNLTPFAELSPDLVVDAVSALGFEPDGRLLALNSFENRVYQVGIEGGEPLIAKFYRPGRWSDAAIHEEHAYATGPGRCGTPDRRAPQDRFV